MLSINDIKKLMGIEDISHVTGLMSAYTPAEFLGATAQGRWYALHTSCLQISRDISQKICCTIRTQPLCGGALVIDKKICIESAIER